jgi:glycosyltransferase involved in cell wall biosynthesis
LLDGPDSGVFKKIKDQSEQWIRYGATVGFFILTRKGLAHSFRNSISGIPIFTFEYGGIPERLRKLSQLYAQVVHFKASIVYYRYDLYHPAFEKIAKQIPVIMEINSDDISEFRLGNRFRHWYNYLTRRYIFLNVKGLVFESHQLAGLPHFARFGRPYLVIGNSIDLQRFRTSPAPKNADPIIVFIGSANQSWHGIEKIFWLARRFKHWRFDLIGSDPGGLKDIPANVVCHGFLSRPRYEPLIAGANVAIGPLSLYLIGKHESSPLKVREYLAYGLPTIIGFQDSDFPQGAPFLLQIGNRPDNVMSSVAKIEEFVNAWQNKRVSHDDIHLLDVRVKEKKRFDFISHFDTSKEEGPVY